MIDYEISRLKMLGRYTEGSKPVNYISLETPSIAIEFEFDGVVPTYVHITFRIPFYTICVWYIKKGSNL